MIACFILRLCGACGFFCGVAVLKTPPWTPSQRSNRKIKSQIADCLHGANVSRPCLHNRNSVWKCNNLTAIICLLEWNYLLEQSSKRLKENRDRQRENDSVSRIASWWAPVHRRDHRWAVSVKYQLPNSPTLPYFRFPGGYEYRSESWFIHDALCR